MGRCGSWSGWCSSSMKTASPRRARSRSRHSPRARGARPRAAPPLHRWSDQTWRQRRAPFTPFTARACGARAATSAARCACSARGTRPSPPRPLARAARRGRRGSAHPSRPAPRVVIGLAADHHAVDLLQLRGISSSPVTPPLIDDLSAGKSLLQAVDVLVAQRRDLAVFLRAQALAATRCARGR